MIRVYQLMLGDARIDELNASGWGSTSWDTAYAKATMGSWGEGDPWDLMRILIDEDILVHTRTVDTTDIDEVFEIGNGMGDMSKETRHAPAKSVSVGDLMVDVDTGVGHIVDSFGFIGVAPHLIREMETKVAMCMMMGDCV